MAAVGECACFLALRSGSPVAVVGCREDGHHLLLVGPVVAFHDQLMGPRDEVQPVGLVELPRGRQTAPGSKRKPGEVLAEI